MSVRRQQTVDHDVCDAGMLAASYTPSELPLLSGFFTISVVVFAVTIPAGPGFIGPFQVGYVLGLSVFGVARSTAAVISIVAHGLQLIMFALFVGAGMMSAPSRTPEEGQEKEARG